MIARRTAPSTSIRKALAILEYVGLKGESGVSEVGRHLKIPKSSVHRLLNALVDCGFLMRSRHGDYRATLKLWRIGAQVTNYEAVRENVLPVLRELVDRTSESALYAVFEGGWSVYVAKVDATVPIRAGTEIGARVPGHASATGKAILAWRSADEIVRVFATAEDYTPDTITDIRKFNREVEKIRKLGYAVSRGEWYAGLWAIAAPIIKPTGVVDSAVGISGPAARFEKNLESYADAVLKAARRLSPRDE